MAQLNWTKKLGKGKKVITVAPDNGERYLSTALYQ
ncbi:cysteine synthase [Ligilactobacillus salivarius SMXD51]|uniref:Cysteine synthase n=1 Tax=Ligilactobacillus salivarius SMXD51 TaxID=1108963 RepID=H7FYW2_9LACO|nr:cysteine synthase [Ligilactobacillus salivarius SMXD51]